MSLPRTIRFLPYAAMLFGVACVVPVSASQIDVLLSVDNRAGGNEGAVNTGYQYFGGITRWTNPSGGYKSRSPVNSAQVSPLMLIAADVTAKIDGKWGAGRPTCYSGYPAHKNSAGRPTGGNQAYVDGSVSWKKFEQMIFIHSWNPGGSRQYYAYQEDLGEYGKSGRIVKPRY